MIFPDVAKAKTKFWVFLLLLLFPVTGFGQLERDSRSDRQNVAPGIIQFQQSIRSSSGAGQVNGFEFHLYHPGASLDLGVAEEGFHFGGALPNFLPVGMQGAVVGLDLAPTFREGENLTGLRLKQNSIVSYSPDDRTHLIFPPQGGVKFYEPNFSPITMHFDEATSFGLVSLNGRLPENPGELALFAGPIAATSNLMTKWQGDLRFFSLERTRRSGQILGPTGEANHAVRGPLRIGRELQRAQVRLSENEAVLVVNGDVEPGLARFLTPGNEFTVRVLLSEEERLARAVLPIGERILKNGSPVEGLTERRENERIIAALNNQTSRFVVLRFSGSGRDHSFERRYQILEYLVGRGFDEAVEIRGGNPEFWSTLGRQPETRNFRTALMFLGQGPTLKGLEDYENYELIIPAVVSGTLREFPANQPINVANRQLGFSEKLDSFWAADFSADSRELANGVEALTFSFAVPVRLVAVDMFHAQGAGFSEMFNLKSYRLSGRTTTRDSWVTLREVRHERPVAIERVELGGNMELRQIRLEILEPNFMPGGKTARLMEMFFWGEVLDGGRRR